MARNCSLFARLLFLPKESAEDTRIAGCKERGRGREAAINSDYAR
jgi:hypothetical protein